MDFTATCCTSVCRRQTALSGDAVLERCGRIQRGSCSVKVFSICCVSATTKPRKGFKYSLLLQLQKQHKQHKAPGLHTSTLTYLCRPLICSDYLQRGAIQGKYSAADSESWYSYFPVLLNFCLSRAENLLMVVNESTANNIQQPNSCTRMIFKSVCTFDCISTEL